MQGKLFLILFVSGVLLYILIIYLKPKYQKKAITQYKNNIYNHILDKNISDFNNHKTATYISALTNDVHKIEEDFIFSVFDLITYITLLLCTIVVMIIYSPPLTLAGIALSLLPFLGALIVDVKLSIHEKN